MKGNTKNQLVNNLSLNTYLPVGYIFQSITHVYILTIFLLSYSKAISI
jgi:hypothetical protein